MLNIDNMQYIIDNSNCFHLYDDFPETIWNKLIAKVSKKGTLLAKLRVKCTEAGFSYLVLPPSLNATSTGEMAPATNSDVRPVVMSPIVPVYMPPATNSAGMPPIAPVYMAPATNSDVRPVVMPPIAPVYMPPATTNAVGPVVMPPIAPVYMPPATTNAVGPVVMPPPIEPISVPLAMTRAVGSVVMRSVAAVSMPPAIDNPVAIIRPPKKARTSRGNKTTDTAEPLPAAIITPASNSDSLQSGGWGHLVRSNPSQGNSLGPSRGV